MGNGGFKTDINTVSNNSLNEESIKHGTAQPVAVTWYFKMHSVAAILVKIIAVHFCGKHRFEQFNANSRYSCFRKMQTFLLSCHVDQRGELVFYERGGHMFDLVT